MRVLSLFDGISCGMVALERAKIPVERYVAYEIEPNAIKISQKNYPQIEHCGDVTTADFTQYKGFDLLLAGFPCQDLSINKADRQGLKGERSGLFWEAVRAISEAKPKYFLIENNHKMPHADYETITKTLGVEPVLMDSKLVSGQQRKRLYWTNIEGIEQPQKKQVSVLDVIEGETSENLINEVVFNSKRDIQKRCDSPLRIGTIGKGGQGERVYSIYGKSVTLKANGGGRGAKTGLYLIGNTVRKLLPLEAERLQTLPDNYTQTSNISPTARIKTIGNGWTVDVIAHILSFLPDEFKKAKGD
jgi:DNA (cytosine-5)-methyltransferase 3A